jgi:hypothetical protein
LALADSLPEIKALQRIDFSWCSDLGSAMPLLLEGLRKNTSMFRFHVADDAHGPFLTGRKERERCVRSWMQETKHFGYRNRCLSLIRTPEETHQPRGIWPPALARVAAFPDDIFQVLRSKPKLVSPEDTEGKKVAEDADVPKKRKRDEK